MALGLGFYSAGFAKSYCKGLGKSLVPLQGWGDRGVDLPGWESHQRVRQPSRRLCGGREELAHLGKARWVPLIIHLLQWVESSGP